MLTVGVDLAAEPARTAVAAIRWSPDVATVTQLTVGADDPAILAAIDGADKAGIDCPLGWPAPFVDFVVAHQANRFAAPEDVAGPEWRRQLAYRQTDLAVRDAVKLWPLSVSTDRIGITAMRCADLLARLARNGQPVDRSGAGVVVEVYPAASLSTWDLPHRRYKGTPNLDQLDALADALASAAPWLTFGRYDADCRRSDHAFDAVVAALTARAAALGQTTGPPEHQAPAAATEGWIALPTQPLRALLGP